jgi:hypothetical protein
MTPQSQYNGAKLKLIIGGGAIFTLTVISTTNPIVLAVGFCFGVFGMGSIASSMNRRGESIQAGSRALALGAVRSPILDAIAEVVADGKESAEESIGRIVKPASEFVTFTATQLGGISESEYEARQLAEVTQIVRKPEHIAELILGHDYRIASTLLLAPRGSGKTTVLHYLVDYVINRPELSIALVVDYDLGSVNKGPVSGWRGLPLWDTELSGRKDERGNYYRATDRSAVFTEPSDFLELLRSLRELFDIRRSIRKAELAKQRAGGTVKPKNFPLIYLFCDEFQNIFATFTDEEKKEIIDIMATLMRSPKHRICVVYAIHDTKATGGIDTATQDKMSIVLMGEAVTGVINNRTSYAHALPRFGEDTRSALATRQKALLASHSPDDVDKMLAAIDIKTPITTSDGAEFRPGNHVLDIPNFQAYVPLPQQAPAAPIEEATATTMPDNVIDIKAASSAKSARVEVLSVPIDVGTVGLEVGSGNWANYWGDKFMVWLTENVDQFEPKQYSVTGFRKISQPHGWGKDGKGDEYSFIQYLARQFQATSPRDDLPPNAIGYIDIPALIDAIGGAS